MTWSQVYDRDFQVRSNNGKRLFVKTDSAEVAEEVRQMGRRRIVWEWSHVHHCYRFKENPCSESPASNA